MTPRHGVALLVALAAVIVVLAALAGTFSQLAATQRAVFIVGVHERHDDLLRAGEQLAHTWIKASSERLVLPPSGGGIRVADDVLAIGDSQARLQVWIFDGLAGVPLAAAQPAGELRGALPGRWPAVGLPPLVPGTTTGVDLIECARLPEGAQRFPAVPSAPVIAWSTVGAAAPQVVAEESTTTASPSLVEVIATASDGRINRNTAPEWLLSALYGQRRQGDLDAALQARQRLVFSEQEDPEERPGIRLVSRSDRWNALIVATWNGRCRAWWVELSGNSAGVRIVQRHDADQ